MGKPSLPSPIVHPHHRALCRVIFDRGIVVEPYEQLGESPCLYPHVGRVPQVDFRCCPLAEVQNARTLAVEHVNAIGGIVEADVFVDKHKVAVEQRTVEVRLDKFRRGKVVVDGEVDIVLPQIYKPLLVTVARPLAHRLVAGVEFTRLAFEIFAYVIHNHCILNFATPCVTRLSRRLISSLDLAISSAATALRSVFSAI